MDEGVRLRFSASVNDRQFWSGRMRSKPFLAPTLLLSTLKGFYPNMLFRKTGTRLKPRRPLLFSPGVTKRQTLLLASAGARLDQQATILYEKRNGSVPTIVLGGFVPDATEQAFLMRSFLLSKGSVFYINYARTNFSEDLLFAQLEDLIEELSVQGHPPVIFAVSFGAGLFLELIKRVRRRNQHLDTRGHVVVSPVGCIQDLLNEGTAKPSTLLGRAIKPFVDTDEPIESASLNKTRGIFTKMFEAGAQNTVQLRALLTTDEMIRLRSAVMDSINKIDAQGVHQRVSALKKFAPLSRLTESAALPLSYAPTLILFAEKESSVIISSSPTRTELEQNYRVYFPHSECRVVRSRGDKEVQHASLIFHYFDFLPYISRFFRLLKSFKASRAA